MKFVIISLIFSFSLTRAAVELSCRPLEDSSCHITRLKGDFTNETIEIQIPHARKTTKVTIEDVKLGSLPETFFKTFKQLEILTINRCSLTDLHGFRSSRTLQQLYLNGNKLTEIGERQLNPGLVYIEAKNNRIKVIHKNAFKNLANLYWVDLAHNRIRKLPKKLITPTMTSINLSGNRIKEIERVFKGHDKIKYLNLASNRIVKITSDTFKNLVNLRELDLSQNEIQEADPTAFDTLRNLKLLKLNQNNLKSFSFAIPSAIMSVLYVDHNEIETLTVYSNQEKLADLSLTAHNNHITSLQLQEELPVISLALQSNKLVALDALNGLKRLEKLNLGWNNLSMAKFSLLPSSINHLNLENTNLMPDQFQAVLNLRHLIFTLNVSNNTRLSEYKFGQAVPCPVALLQMTGCGITELSGEDLKRTFRNLKEVHLGGNQFRCDDLRSLVEALKGTVVVKAGVKVDSVVKIKGTNTINGILCL